MDNIEQSQPKRKRLGIFIVGFLLLVSLAVNGIMIAKSIDDKKNNKLSGSVCGDNIIEKYNKVYNDSNSTNKEYFDMLDQIQSKDNYKDDANCVYLAYISSIHVGKQSSEYFDLLSKNIENGKNPSLKIDDLYSFSQIKRQKRGGDNKLRGAI